MAQAQAQEGDLMNRIKLVWRAYLTSRWAPIADAVIIITGAWLFIVMMFVM
jgi:hypothetical protein